MRIIVLAILAAVAGSAATADECGDWGRVAETVMELRESGLSERELLSEADGSLFAQEIVRAAFSLPESADPEQFGEDIKLICRQ